MVVVGGFSTSDPLLNSLPRSADGLSSILGLAANKTVTCVSYFRAHAKKEKNNKRWGWGMLLSVLQCIQNSLQIKLREVRKGINYKIKIKDSTSYM